MFPVKALSSVFRARFVASLRKALPNEPKAFFNSLFQTNWVVYAKRPFGGPLQVIEYLGRYTHKIAISNHRITDIGNDAVSFIYKDYRQDGAQQQMTLDAAEFIRRFALHILPKGFVRIRHYGILSSKLKVTALPAIRKQLQHPGQPATSIEKQPTVAAKPIERTCPCCKKGIMQHVMDFDYRGPRPLYLLKELLKDGTNPAMPKMVV